MTLTTDDNGVWNRFMGAVAAFGRAKKPVPEPALPPATWVSKTKTSIKRSTEQASALADEEKIEIEAGQVIVSDHDETVGNHCKLSGVSLDGKPLADVDWFVWSEHFDRTRPAETRLVS